MREIKFRAWDKVSNKFRGINGTQDLFSIRCDGFVHEDYVLQQYTGIKDKDGVEIYEGDIIECKFHPMWYERISWQGEPDATCEVYYDYCGFGLKVTGESDTRYTSCRELLEVADHEADLLLRMANTESKVIGNIYENRESVSPQHEPSKTDEQDFLGQGVRR